MGNENNNSDDGLFNKSPISDDVFCALRSLRVKNVGRVIIATLNVNSIANKLDQLKFIIKDNIDVLVLTETKIDGSFPENQFLIEGYSIPFRYDRNRYGGGILIYVREDIPSKIFKKHNFPDDIEGMFIELNFRKTKWLMFGTYHPPSQNDNYYFDEVAKAIDLYYGDYDKFLLAGDFNAEDTEPKMVYFLDQYNAKNLVKENTCFKSLNNPSCVDLLITNSYRSFQNTIAISTGLSDFHKMSLTILKTKFEKNKPKLVHYRDYKNFNNESFKNDLQRYTILCTTYETFEKVFMNLLEIHAPLKQRYIRANEVPYMTRILRKAIMKRSQLESKFYKTKSASDQINYKRQKNYVSRLYKKEIK